MCRITILNTRKLKEFFPGWIVMISSTAHSQSRRETHVVFQLWQYRLLKSVIT